MIDNNSNSRLKIDPLYDGLNLNFININTDDFGIMIDKINNNFKEVSNYGGGPMGPPGPIGEPGCPGEPGPPGPPGESDINWTASNTLKCDSAVENYSTVDLNNDVISNRFSYSSLLLSNLYLDDESQLILLANSDKKETFTIIKYPELFNNYKLKLLNSHKYSENSGSFEGQHIHLLNSKAVEIDNRFLCKSGFTISNDFSSNDSTSNYEILRIKAEKQTTEDFINPLKEHKLDIELLSDTFILGKNLNSQKFFIDTTIESASNNKNGFLIDEQTSINSVNFPDRPGYLPIWQDTLERGENWEIVTAEDLLIYSSSYLNVNQDIIDVPMDENTEHWVDITTDSYVRFKRMNNWVLVDYRIGLLRNSQYDNFTLRNIIFLVNKETLRCRTNGWHLSTVMENETLTYDNKSVNVFGFFKLDGTSLDSAPSFSILNKFHYNIFNVMFSSTNEDVGEQYYINGQIWATITSEDEICDLLAIEQCAVCPELIISEQN